LVETLCEYTALTNNRPDIDWYSRRVLSWRISNSMEAAFCVDYLADALRHHGTPEIFNSDQGSQFTSAAFTDVLKREGVVISMNVGGAPSTTSLLSGCGAASSTRTSI
jgi:transposase InsO family protein